MDDIYHYFLNGYIILYLLNTVYMYGKLHAYFQRKFPLSAPASKGEDARVSFLTSCVCNFTLFFPLLISPDGPFYNVPYVLGSLVATYVVLYFMFGKNKYGILFW